MERAKAAAIAYRLYTSPQAFSTADMMCLFFSSNDRWAVQRWEDEVMAGDIKMPTHEEEQAYLQGVDACIHNAHVADAAR